MKKKIGSKKANSTQPNDDGDDIYDADIDDASSEFFAKALFDGKKESMTIKVDPIVKAFFKEFGEEQEIRIASILRNWMLRYDVERDPAPPKPYSPKQAAG